MPKPLRVIAPADVRARRLAKKLALSDERTRVCFQSRLGREPWIRPYTDQMLVDDAKSGCRRAVIVGPG